MMAVEWTVHLPVVTIPPPIIVPWIVPCTARAGCAGIFIPDGVGCAAAVSSVKVSFFFVFFWVFHRVGPLQVGAPGSLIYAHFVLVFLVLVPVLSFFFSLCFVSISSWLTCATDGMCLQI